MKYHPYPEAIVFNEVKIDLIFNAISDLFKREKEGISRTKINICMYYACMIQYLISNHTTHTHPAIT